ncbi:hypothetical protein [Streptomyces sp. NPDC056948]|uniref:hypothetical protein n=1 Tax=Streptomyces sp. NPDC056948 TaxID=3345975 RepID=UPI00363F8A5C
MTTNTAVFQDGALYFDQHGDIWRATSGGTELTHVKRRDEMATPNPAMNPWSESAEKIEAGFGPMEFLVEALQPAQEAMFLFALAGKDAADANVVHRALGLLDAVRTEAAR